MEKMFLGGTEIEVSRLCIGCMQASGWFLSDESRSTTVRRALDSGLDFWDTVVTNGDGYCEELDH
jgi:aryl-alcohol dehydrogenase-like predicted oxidoreductase